MRLRRVTPNVIVNALISATKAGLTVKTTDLEAHYLAGGNVLRVVNALIAADKAKIDLNFQHATAIDLAGRDVFGSRAGKRQPSASSRRRALARLRLMALS